jgi:hypothetical protein
MRHQALELGDVVIVERRAVAPAMEPDHGEAAIGAGQGAAQAFLESERPKKLAEEYAGPMRLLRQKPVPAAS